MPFFLHRPLPCSRAPNFPPAFWSSGTCFLWVLSYRGSYNLYLLSTWSIHFHRLFLIHRLACSFWFSWVCHHIWHDAWPSDFQYSSQAFELKSVPLPVITFIDFPCLISIELPRGWNSLNFIVIRVISVFEFHICLSFLNDSIALQILLSRSSPPPACWYWSV